MTEILITLFLSLWLCILPIGFTYLKPALKDSANFWLASLLWVIGCSMITLAVLLIDGPDSPNLLPQGFVQANAIGIQLTSAISSSINELPFTFQWAGIDLVSFAYLFVLSFLLLRLALGRMKVVKIAKDAIARQIGSHTVFVTDIRCSPFALQSVRFDHIHRIVLPKGLVASLSQDQIEAVIQHERCHIKHRDDLIGLWLKVLGALFWPNLLLGKMIKHWRAATEIRADSAAVKGKSKEARHHYASMLINIMKGLSDKSTPFVAPAFFTRSTNKRRLEEEKMRINSIIQPPNRTQLSLTGKFVALVTFLIFGAFSSAIASNSKQRAVSTLLGDNQQAILTGRLTAAFGTAPDPFGNGKKRNHKGIDIGAEYGTPIYSPSKAKVLVATDLYKNNPKYGKVVVIETANGTKTLFAHLGEYKVKAGQKLRPGQLIAEVGSTGLSTGPHVHVETFVDGVRVDPRSVWQLAE